jgi:DNA-binding NarL/FixJ family response regulator
MVVDDQAVVRAGLRTILRDAPDMRLVEETGDGAHAVDLAARRHPDVVLTEIRLTGTHGADLIRRIRTVCGSQVIVLTTLDHDQHVLACLRAGASGFLLKDTPPAELLSAIRAVAAGDAVVAPAVTRRLVDRLVDTLPTVNPVLDSLTAREQEVLELIAEGLSNADIAARLYMSVGTVKAHVSRILTKLGLRDRIQAVVLAYQSGLVRPRGTVA